MIRYILSMYDIYDYTQTLDATNDFLNSHSDGRHMDRYIYIHVHRYMHANRYVTLYTTNYVFHNLSSESHM